MPIRGRGRGRGGGGVRGRLVRRNSKGIVSMERVSAELILHTGKKKG